MCFAVIVRLMRGAGPPVISVRRLLQIWSVIGLHQIGINRQ
jgi:hypothetical protein